MPLTNPQKNVIQDDSRFRVLITGRRFCKTFVAINEIAKFASIPNKKIWYVNYSTKEVIRIDYNTLIGDINQDETLNILDVIALVNSILEEEELTNQQLIIADQNLDGLINILDVISLVNTIINSI